MRPLLLFILFFHTSLLFAQPGQPGQWLQQLKTATSDSARIPLLIQLANYYNEAGQFAQSAGYAQQVVALRENKVTDSVMILTLTFTGQMFLNNKNFVQARHYWERALALRERTNKMNINGLETMLNVALICFNAPDRAAAEQLYQKGLGLSKTLNSPKNEHKCRLFLSRIYTGDGQFALAQQHLEATLALCRKYHFSVDEAVALNGMLSLYAKQGNITLALEYGLASLKKAEATRAPEVAAATLNDITPVFQLSRQFTRALAYLDEAAAILKGSPTLQPFIELNRGAVYMGMGKYDSAFFFTQKALNTAKPPYTPEITTAALANLVYLAQQNRNYIAAFQYLQQAETGNKSFNSRELEAKIKSSTGAVYLHMAQDKETGKRPDSLRTTLPETLARTALHHLQQSANICRQINSPALLQANFRLMAEARQLLNDIPGAKKDFTEYMTLRDSLFANDKTTELNRLEYQYRFDKQAAEKDKQLALTRAAGAYRLQIAIFAGVALLLLAGVIAWFTARNRKNKYRLQLTALKLEALNARMSDHFISNTTDSINQLIVQHEPEKASEYLARFHRLIRKVLDNATEGMVPLAEDLAVLTDYIELEKLRFPNNGLNYTIETDPEIDTGAVYVPPMVLQIFAENAIRHGLSKTRNSRLDITLQYKNRQYIACTITDNGTGRTVQPATPARKSHGTELAEKLLEAAGERLGKTELTITDLYDTEHQPAGTRVQLLLPCKTDL